MSAIWFLLVFICIMGGVVALAGFAYLRTDGAKRPASGGSGEAIRTASGRSVTATLVLGAQDRAGNRSPPTLHLVTSVDEGSEGSAGAYRGDGRAHAGARPGFLLRRERSLDRLGKRLGLNREVQTGDTAFDELVYIEADAPARDVKRVVGEASFRKAVLDLFDEGATRIELDATGLSVARLCRRDEDAEDPARIERLSELLATAVDALPLFEPGRVAKRRTMTVMLVGLGALLVSSFVLFTQGLQGAVFDTGPARAVAFPVAVGLWALAVFFGVLRYSGRSDALRRIAILGGAMLISIPLGVHGGLLWANWALDPSPPIDHRTVVTGKWIRGGGKDSHGATRAHVAGVTVTSWRPGETTREITSDTLYTAMSVGSTVVVTTHAGRLGWEWLVGTRRE